MAMLMYPVIYPIEIQSMPIVCDGVISLDAEQKPVYKNRYQRRLSIAFNLPAYFYIADDFSYTPPYPVLDKWEVISHYNGVLRLAAEIYGVDVNLARAIFLMETSNCYSSWIDPLRRNRLPMNIHYDNWKELAGSKDYIQNPNNNIEIGVLILKRIQDKLKDPSIAKIASVFHQIEAMVVNEYGAKAAMLYQHIKYV